MIIVITINKANKFRSLNNDNKNQVKSLKNRSARGIITLLSLSFIIIFVNYPLMIKAVFTIISSNDCLISYLKQISQYVWLTFDSGIDQLSRLGDCLVFYVTINKFREVTHNLIRCKIPNN